MSCSRLLSITLLLFIASCAKIYSVDEADECVSIILDPGLMMTKSEAPSDEDVVSDLNLFIVNENGSLDEHLYIKKNIIYQDGQYRCKVKLAKGMTYSIYALGNLGYKPTIRNFEELISFRYWLSRPDDYHGGIAMSGYVTSCRIGDEDIVIPMTRVMSKVTVDVDRSRLAKGVRFEVTSIEIGNCPRSVLMFGKGAIKDDDNVFPVGFSCDKVPATVYMLENVESSSQDYASYIEIKAEYDSDEIYTKEGNHLIYRFYIGNDRQKGVERNCHYRITVIPVGDGLGGVDVSNWRIDKSELSNHYNGDPYLVQHPSSYIECYIGDTVHIWCDVYPPDAPFDVGLEFLEDDHLEGRYDYEIDETGHGAYLTMTEGGMGWVYMEAGEPVNDAALFVIMCEP